MPTNFPSVDPAAEEAAHYSRIEKDNKERAARLRAALLTAWEFDELPIFQEDLTKSNCGLPPDSLSKLRDHVIDREMECRDDG